MFPETAPRLFGLPPGRDLAADLLRGLEERLDGAPPEAWARVTIYLPSRRLQRHVRDAFDAGPPRMVPRLRLVSDVALDPAGADLPPPVPALRRRLELSQLVAALLTAEPGLAPRARLFDLSDSLADLMEEMQGEGVPPEIIAGLDIADLSGHWGRSVKFLRVLEPWFAAEGAPDGDARMRRVTERLATLWATDPPRDPVIVAGATGSRGATARFMELVARLPQGAVILPGFDFDLPASIWDRLDSPLTGEDHPQFLYAGLLRRLGLACGDVRPWQTLSSSGAQRAALVSLSLRPPPVTDQWIAEGPRLGDLGPACAGLTLLEAPSPRAEAEAIALRMRQAIEEGRTCALVTPDRTLSRAVAAALDRWGVVPDDSAGEPLPLSPPGRLLRQVAEARSAGRLTAEALLSLLKHPLCHAGTDRGAHLRRTHALELSLRRRGPPFPDAGTIRAFAAREAGTDPGAGAWADWLAPLVARLATGGDRPLALHLAEHLTLAEAMAAGPVPEGPNPLWAEAAGREARAICEQLARHADAGGHLTPRDYASLFAAVLAQGEVRDRDRGHPRALIWGTLEARAQGADLVILGGMNEGIWPSAAPLDPWLNRRLRETVGLPLPERRIGQAALDYAMALGAPEAWITRAVRSDEAPTVPSRWLNRLLNLLDGLPSQGGPAAVEAMRARGRDWLTRAAAISRPDWRTPLAPRPSPRPPVAARPKQLSVTTIERLLRDPYAVYADRILRLRALDPLSPEPDALERGVLLHSIVEKAMAKELPPDPAAAREMFLATARSVLIDECPWPVMQRVWLAHLARIADAFLTGEMARRTAGAPALLETPGQVVLEDLGITVTARPDRIDRRHDGTFVIFDYKSGTPPSKADQLRWAKQLLLTAALAQEGAFSVLGRVEIADAAYLGLGSDAPVVHAPLADLPPTKVWEELRIFLASWLDPARGYSARMAIPSGQRDREGDYDHLARFGEWDHSTPVTPEDLL